MGSIRTNNDDTGPASLPQQTVIVTGGNSGLGYGCASALLSASPSWHVIIACRDPGRAQEAVEKLRDSARPGSKVETMALNLASLASVRSFAAKLKDRLKAAELPPLHGLVCNAAVQGARTFTTDGFESTFGVSHLGHYLLVNLLVLLMEKPARIAVVASGVHDPAELAKVPASMAKLTGVVLRQPQSFQLRIVSPKAQPTYRKRKENSDSHRRKPPQRVTAEEAADPLLTVDDVARRLNVSRD